VRLSAKQFQAEITADTVAYLGFGKGGAMASGTPSGVQGQSPWSGGHGGEAPLKLKHLLLNVQWKPQIRSFF